MLLVMTRCQRVPVHQYLFNVPRKWRSSASLRAQIH
jgi:hypothetical protein